MNFFTISTAQNLILTLTSDRAFVLYVEFRY